MELSYSDISSLLRTALQQVSGTNNYVWIRDVYPSSVVYEDEANGGLFKRDYVIDAQAQVTLGDPVAVIEQTSYQPVIQTSGFTISFSGGVTGDAGGDYIEKEGLLFKAGYYADKKYGMSADEIQAAVAAFKPVALELEHYDSEGKPNILSGKFGTLTGIYSPDNGQTLYGKAQIAKWVKDAVGDAPLKTSAVWDRATKTLQRVGLVLEPRITEAALMGAYANFAGKRHNQQDQAAIQAAHDKTVEAGATCAKKLSMHSSAPGASGKESKKRMGLKELWAKFVSDLDPKEVQAAIADEAPFAVEPAKEKERPAPSEREKQLEAQIAEFKASQRKADGESFAEAAIREKKALPAEKAALLAMYTQAAADDEANPQQVAFSGSDGKATIGSRVDALKAMIAARPAHSLTEEQLSPNGNLRVLFAEQEGAEGEVVEQAQASAKKYAEQVNGKKGA